MMALCLLLCIASPSMAAEVGSKSSRAQVIDVGDIEIKGELRRPFLQYLDSERSARELLPKFAKESLEAFEARLLEPAPPKRAKGPVAQEKQDAEN